MRKSGNTVEKFAWLVRIEAVAQLLVLTAALVMSAPGEYELAIWAGWSPKIAWLLPVLICAYFVTSWRVAEVLPLGTPGGSSARFGIALASALALSAQITAHRLAAGYMVTSDALVSAISSIPLVATVHAVYLVAVCLLKDDGERARR